MCWTVGFVLVDISTCLFIHVIHWFSTLNIFTGQIKSIGFFSHKFFVCVSNLGFKMFYTCGPNEAMVVSGNGLIIVSVIVSVNNTWEYSHHSICKLYCCLETCSSEDQCNKQKTEKSWNWIVRLKCCVQVSHVSCDKAKTCWQFRVS